MRQPNPRMTAASFAGAVDLSSLRKTTPPPASAPASAPDAGAAAGGPPPPGGAASAHVIDVTEATFQAEVLERSLRTPVVIDFWAEWCGPCKQLSPVLEKLAAEGGGSWVLAKIDIDANQRLAAAFRVQSIPFVVAVVGGQPVDGFAGVQPEAQLRQWLAALVKASGGAAQGEGESQVDPRLVEADEKMQSGDLDGAEKAFQAMLADAPNDPIAASGMAQVRLLRRIEGINGYEVLAAADAAPNDVQAQIRAADVEFVSGMADRAFDRLIGVVRRSAGDDRDAARTHLLDLFAIAAPDDPVVVKARRDLTSALF